MTAAKQSQLVGVAGLAAALLVVAFVGHQLVTAVHGAGAGLLLALAIPSATAMGGLLGSRTRQTGGGGRLQARAAMLAAAAGGSLLVTAVAITWASRRIAKAKGASQWWDVLAISLGWLLVAALLGAAIALTLRARQARLGRALFATSLGAAIASLALPFSLHIGAPHLVLLVAGLIAVSALLLGHAGRAGKPHWPLLWTLPLVAAAMFAGDMGQPWLKLRTDVGRRSNIDHHEWTTEGLVSVNKLRRGKGTLRVGDQTTVPLAKKLLAKQKPPFKKQDLIYTLNDDQRGAVLVIGSLGGREVTAARAYGHPLVHNIAPQPRVLDHLLLHRYAAATGYALYDPPHIDFSVGNGQSRPWAHWGRYQYVVVMGDDHLRRTPPWLLPHDDQRYTTTALRSYVAYLDASQHGAVSLQVSDPTQLPAVFATAREVLRASFDEPLQHLAVCSDKHDAVVLMSLAPLDPPTVAALRRRCRSGRMKLIYPATKAKRPRKGKRAADPTAAPRALLLAGHAADDELPFVGAPAPPPRTWPALLRQALLALRPTPPAENKQPRANTPKRANASRKIPPPTADEPAALTERESRIGLGTAAGLAALLMVLLAMGLAPRRRDVGGAMRLALPLFGVATATVTFALSNMTLEALGDDSLAWSLVLPLGMLGWGGGGLVADVPRALDVRRTIFHAGVLGVLALTGVALLVGPVAMLDQLSASGATYAGGALLLIGGIALGATPMLCAKLLGDERSDGSGWSWSAHHAGWALGSAVALLLAHYLPMRRLLFLGVASYALAAVCVAVALRRR